MLSLFRGRSRFARALMRYGLGRCSVSHDLLWIGLPPHGEYHRAPLDAVPGTFRALRFVEGPDQADLVAAFAASPESESVESLMIGTSHDYRGNGEGPLDISAAVLALRDATMPMLTRLSLGDMEMLFNGHAYYGRVGDIAHVFAAAPNLLCLCVCGRSDLARPVSHERLEEFHIRLDDIGVSGGPLSQATVDNITSRFPRLRTLELSLDEADATPYSVPEAFFADNGFPALERFGMDRLEPEAEPRLRAWAAGRGLRWTL